MASTTQYYTRPEQRRFLPLLLPCLLLIYPVTGQTEEPPPFSVRSISVNRSQQDYLLDSIVDFNLNETVLNALHNGVSLTLVMQMQLYRERKWLWDKNVSDITRRFSLRYFALSQLYLLTDLESQDRHSFVTLGAALYHLGHMQTPLAPLHEIMAGQSHYLRMQTLLDIESLPASLRPLAYLSSHWRLKSKWKQWPIEI
ncbi:MAG: DUF4390 domain-containing protein [Gammaproteobacteria bacterium]|nr:DUF4390 domain-containing protein [Gammaproteobacteria bacterium]